MVLLMTSCIFKRTSTDDIITVILSGLEKKTIKSMSTKIPVTKLVQQEYERHQFISD